MNDAARIISSLPTRGIKFDHSLTYSVPYDVRILQTIVREYVFYVFFKIQKKATC